MKRTKQIFQWFVGIVVGTYLMMTLLLNIPIVQRWLASGVASVLEDVIESKVEIGRVEISWNGRLIVTDLMVEDLQHEEMLRVARVAVLLSINDIIHKRVRIGNAQLFGMHANLYQECADCDPNFKFLVDAFASKDTTKHTPLDLRISQLLVRRGNVKWEQRWKKKALPAYLELTDLNITAQINCLTDDSLNIRVKRFDVKEYSGIDIKSLSFYLKGNREDIHLSNLSLELPNSKLNGDLRAARNGSQHLSGTLKAHLSPTDFKTLIPQLEQIKSAADLNVAFQNEGERLTISSLHIQDADGKLRLKASGWAENLKQGKDSIKAYVDIQDLYAENTLLQSYSKIDNNLLNRLTSVSAKGKVAYNKGEIKGKLDARTPVGKALVEGSGNTDGTLNATLQARDLQLGEVLKKKDLGILSLDIKAKGRITNKHPHLIISGFIPEVDYKGYRYRNIDIQQLAINDSEYGFQLSSGDPNASLSVDGKVDLKQHVYNVKADVTQLKPNTLNLTKRFVDTDFSGNLFVDLKGTQPEKMDGVVQLNDFIMMDSTGVYRPGDIHLTSRFKGDMQHIMVISPFLEAQVEGDFEPNVIFAQVKRMVSNYLPSASSQFKLEDLQSKGKASFTLRAYNSEPIRRLLGVPLTLKGVTTANGEIDSEHNALWVNLTSPFIEYGKEHLRNLDLHIESNFESMLANISLQRQMKGRWINLGLDTQGYEGSLNTHLFFDNNVSGFERPSRTYAGTLNLVSRLWKDEEGKQRFEGKILKSDLVISDTIWTIHPGYITYYDERLQVDSFQVSQGNDRFIRVDGCASRSETDTLHAQLQRINLEYIFSLINFHAVELTGEATGDAYAHSLFSSPKADAFIRIPQFALNYGTMGDLDIRVNWGERPYSIFLDGRIEDRVYGTRTLVDGYITPKKDIDYHGLDLNVKADHVNLEFINKWTAVIFDDLQGRATGWVHIFGPFKQVNIEGDAVVNEASVGVPFIGVRYHLENDSVQLRPDNIYFTDAHLYDPQGNPNVRGHQALVTGHLHHNSFKDMSYDISIKGDNVLGYNFKDFGDQNFYGTVYATGDVTLKGYPGMTRIGIKAHPERGTTFTYNATSPDKLTETPFITYKQAYIPTAPLMEDEMMSEDLTLGFSNALSTNGTDNGEGQSNNDLYIDFDLDIDDQSTMNLLMDARSGDKITLNGYGHMLANYYNKGSFDLFGTYRVNRGTYNLSLQEVIRKNFEFSPDGTITFNGEPYGADLNLQAVHTVSGVSLNDINPKANFSNTTTRVNCLMNIGGKAREPRISFDFDIPNANEEEKQMVRSLISTDEERNMQVVYLLGIGRFYNYNYVNDNQSQGTTAMYSVLSSTLSGTINQALSNMIGSRNWNVGANLRTGQDGWNDMDVEGMLQGNLLNNRLLINGNFGYRENPVANSNFIGDFDVKYLLTRSGTVALKAYSETNDRYFTKSALTTQGIGVLLKKDFTSWHDIITKRKRKK